MSAFYDGWDGNHGGTIHCAACFNSEIERCDVCESKRCIALRGSAEDNIQGDANDVFRTVALIAQSAQHEFPRSAMEWLEQPAKWIRSYEFLLPFLSVEIEAKRKREDARRS